MAKSELFLTLEDISFAVKDPAVIEQEIISQYETLSGRTLARGDPVRVFLDSIILVIIQQRNLIDLAAKQNLLAYATGANLDHIGALLGVSRLSASSATCMVEFKLSAVQNFSVFIPVGTRVTPDGDIFYALNETIEIPIGELTARVECVCETPGQVGNGYIPGQINKIVDVFPYEMSVYNITASSGGSDVENDENFRERIQIAPESFTTAGSKEAYRYYARTAHPDIIDVSILTASDGVGILPGCVEIVPLMSGGIIPSDGVINAVYEACNAEDIRPDTDYVIVRKPQEVLYDVSAVYWVDAKKSASLSVIMQKVEAAFQDWVLWQRSALGRDVNPSELTRRILEAGAKRCEIHRPVFRVLGKGELAVMNMGNVTYVGLEES